MTPEIDAEVGGLRERVETLERECDELAVAADRYRDLYEHGPDMYFMVDIATGTIVECSEAAATELGYAEPDLVGRNVSVLYPTELLEEFRALTRRFVRAGAVREDGLSVQRSDGTRIPVSISVTAVRDDAGRIVRVGTVLRDISKQRRLTERLVASERRLRQLAENLPLIPWEAVVDVPASSLERSEDRSETRKRAGSWMSAATLTYVGPQIESVLGYTPEEFSVPGFWLSLIHPDDRDWEPNRSDRDLRDGETYLAGYRMQARDGSFVYLRSYIDVVHDGERVFLTGVLLDVTDRRRASEERRRMMLELDHRVKDSLSTVRAMARRSARSGLTVEEFRDRFTSRMRNMSRLHDALSAVRWCGLRMDQVASLALAPIASSEHLRVEGPRVDLPAAAAQSLGLVLHELALNALAHGALSTPSGEIELRWDRSGGPEDSALWLEWIERGVDSSPGQRNAGLGTFMLEHVLPYELDARVRTLFTETGVRCTLVVPLPGRAAAA